MVDVVERERRILEYWKKNNINQKVREKAKNGKKFYFLDGPPYVTGDLHPGQMWVKTIKDITLRYRRYRGYNVRDRAGYDVHGLPIENKVEKLIGVNSKREIETKIGIEEFVKRCREFVDSFMGKMDKDYERFGMSLNFENPYLAYRNEFIEAAWEMLKRINDNGYLYRGKKTTAFCTRCGTSLAQGSMEVEYMDTEDPSIYVAFKIDKKTSKPKAEIKLGDESYLLIWTTTPWTLPANVSVAANPKERYVLAHANGKDLVVAKKRLDAVAAEINESVTVKAEFFGSELDGVFYLSPLEEKVPEQKNLRKSHKVVMAEELVSMEDGTGLVHMAPGHGLEDYQIGVKNGLPIFSPVATDGTYTDEAGAYKGLHVPKDANDAVLKDLAHFGALLSKGTIKHSYPKCWRCDTKLIYIATEQWFFNIQRVKQKLLKENDKVIWHPPEAQKWQADVLTASPDWCISRQRYWGIPLPIWICSQCKETMIIGAIQELKDKEISGGHAHSLNDLHRPHIDKVVLKCDKCGGEAKRITDVIDVWFDASIAFRASMTKEEFEVMFPIDYILEGKDQLRGWFSYLLKTSVMAYGKRPFVHIGIDGMLLDEHGREMHKKLGNYVPLDEIHKSPGADTFRLWCADHTPWLDLNWNKEELKDAGKVITILDNISNLISEYQDAIGYKPEFKGKISVGGLEDQDLWILSRLESTIDDATKYLDDFEAFNAAYAVKRFVTEDFSRFYLKLAKKRILYGSKRSQKKVIDVINYLLFRTLVIISPITPFVSESIYHDRFKNKESIFLEDWPKANKRLMNKDLEKQMEVAKDSITALLSSREKANISLRWPLSSETLELTSDDALAAVQRLTEVIKDYTNSKSLEAKRIFGIKQEVKPLFNKIGPDFKDKAGAVANALKSANAEEVKKAIDKDGYYSLHTQMGTVDIKPEHFTYVQVHEESDALVFKHGKAFVDRNLSNELKDEALVREFERRVQLMRKELKLKKVDKIELGYEAVGEINRAISDNSKKIAKDLNSSALKTKRFEHGLDKEFEIEGEIVKVSIKKI